MTGFRHVALTDKNDHIHKIATGQNLLYLIYALFIMAV